MTGMLQLVLFSTMGILTSTFVGYCIYFDYKRIRAPDYKKKLKEKRLKQQQEAKSGSGQQQQVLFDLSNPMVRDSYIKSEYEKGIACLMQSDAQSSIVHFINVVQLSSEPLKMIGVFRQILPPELYLEFVQQMQQLNAQTSLSMPNGDTKELNESVALD